MRGGNIIVNLEKDQRKSIFASSLDNLTVRFVKLLRSPALYVFLLLVSVGLAYGIAVFGIIFGLIFLGVIIGLPVIIYSITNHKFGIVVLLIISFFLQGINRFMPGVPLGILLDTFLAVMMLGLIIKKWRNNDYTLASNMISYVVWIWIIYNFAEFFNPMGSKQAWLLVIRGMALLLGYYFIILSALDKISFAKVLINIWIAFSLLGAAYGLFQEFHGLFPAEKAWVMADDFRFDLIFNWGRYRIFSFFNDPTVFGVLMAYTGLFCITLIAGPFSLRYKIYLAVCAGAMLLAMVYAGTRTAYVMIPAGLAFYALLTMQKRALTIGAIIGVAGMIIIFSDIRSLGPFLNTNNLERIRSAFKPSEDPSFQVRERSQAFIKPFIQSHPMGGGLGSVGIWGRRFTPGSPIANFAPDSGYVRVAVELGWIGLIIYCLLFVAILVVGIHNYYKIRDPVLKAYMAGILAVVYSLVVANYPQEVLIQVPTVLIFYVIMALVVKLKDLDAK